MSNREIEHMVRQANPVPDLAILEPYELTDLEESIEQGALEILTSQRHSERLSESLGRRSRRRRSFAMALVAVAAVGLLVMVDSGISSFRDQTPDVAAVPQSANELTTIQARALALTADFLDARSRGEDGLVDMLVLLDDDAEVGWGIGSSSASLRATLRWEEAVQLTYTVNACVVTPSDAAEVGVQCYLDQDSPMADVLGNVLEPAIVGFTLRDGQITKITFDDGNFDKAVWFPFRRYMIAKHRDEVGDFYSSTKDGWPPKQHKTGFLFWALRVDEFIEYYQNPPPPTSLRDVLGNNNPKYLEQDQSR